MPNPIPEEWEFIKWDNRNQAFVLIPNNNYGASNYLTLVQPHQNPFYAAILAAHGPVHEPTEEELAREQEIEKNRRKLQNAEWLGAITKTFASSVDNPSHWNRVNPERKAEYLAYYRNLLKLQEHEMYDGDDFIWNHYEQLIPNVLEDMEGSPHRETNILIAENTPLFRGDILVRKTGDGAVDSHTRNFCGEHATVNNTVLNANFDLFLATNGIMSDEGLYVDTNGDFIVKDEESFAVASERGLITEMPVGGAPSVNDRLCFRPLESGKITLDLDHPHGWPDCGFTISKVHPNGMVDFWWDGREAEKLLRHLADPRDVCLLPDLQVEDGCMTILTAGTDHSKNQPCRWGEPC